MPIVMSVINSKIRANMSRIVTVKTTITNGMGLQSHPVPGAHRRPCSDYNFIRSGDQCVPAGPEPVPPNVCTGNDPDETYYGSSGYRLIPGNTCDKDRGVRKDEPVKKSCSKGDSSCHFPASQV